MNMTTTRDAAKTGKNREKTAASAIAVVVPCYRERASVLGVLEAIGPEVSHIFVVDDACPDGTGAYVAETCTDDRVAVLTHAANRGVGAATLTGIAPPLDAG